ncbi:MAG: ATP-binding protein [Methanobrevibacter sp.]|nr:ATP-binding protein [Methanobrevibacter sp.]
MDAEDKNTLHNYIQNQINNMPSMLNEELSYKNEKFTYRSDFKIIIEHVDDFINGDNINRYIVLPGLRGVGKTTMLFQIYDYLLKEKQIPANQILYISCETLNKIIKCDILKTVEQFVSEIHQSSLMTIDEKLFLLIDESHFDKNWSLSGKIIYDKTKRIFMIFTGSSAINLEYHAEAARRMLRYPINPLNFSQHLKLKFNYESKNITKELIDLIFDGEITNSKKIESEIITELLNLAEYTSQEWGNYFRYGGFPSVMHDKNYRISQKKLLNSIDSVITKDLKTLQNINQNSEDYAYRLLKLLAQKVPGEISQNTLADLIKSSPSTANSILGLLEKTHLIFHYEPYSGPNARIKKSWQYYFATPSLRHAINSNWGFSPMNQDEYEGILLENLVASGLFNLKNNEEYFDFDIFFDPLKDGVDFLVRRGFENPIPIEVGHGNKTKRQITKAISRYNSTHGIIISNTTNNIEKKDNVIYLPYKTFSLI